MKKFVLGFLYGILLLCVGCGGQKEIVRKPVEEKKPEAEITIMDVDAKNPEFQQFIKEAEEKLQMKINLVPCPQNADNRQAKISTILAAGESSVDIFSVNDEMISEFKYKGYLEPLNQKVMTPDLISKYPETYIKNISMDGDNIYSVPYFMDVMVFWVNKQITGDREIASLEDFKNLLKEDLGADRYGYGSAWDSAYVYNELSEFINLFGGSYYDWNQENTRKALSFLHDMAEQKLVPVGQTADQYEQMEQKFLDGKYASVFMYSGAMDIFERAGAYREDWIQAVRLPMFQEQVTNIATWQYVLNKSSEHKADAIRFLQYAASREGSVAYAEYMNRLPARLDIIREENLDVPGFEVLRDYVEHVQLKERPLSENAMEDIKAMGSLFQKYVMDEISQDEFCEKAQNITDGF